MKTQQKTVLPPAIRKRVLDDIERDLRAVASGLFNDPQRPGGPMAEVTRHLDGLVDIVRRTTATRIEPYLAEILDDICTHCEFEQPSQFCARRDEGKCVLFSHTRTIVDAIARALRDTEDFEYWWNHPVGSGDLKPGGDKTVGKASGDAMAPRSE